MELKEENARNLGLLHSLTLDLVGCMQLSLKFFRSIRAKTYDIRNQNEYGSKEEKLKLVI